MKEKVSSNMYNECLFLITFLTNNSPLTKIELSLDTTKFTKHHSTSQRKFSGAQHSRQSVIMDERPTVYGTFTSWKVRGATSVYIEARLI